jgi:hypothetical protein
MVKVTGSQCDEGYSDRLWRVWQDLVFAIGCCFVGKKTASGDLWLWNIPFSGEMVIDHPV